MNDEQIIRLMGFVWLLCGGDAAGFSWNWRAIQEEIERIEQGCGVWKP